MYYDVVFIQGPLSGDKLVQVKSFVESKSIVEFEENKIKFKDGSWLEIDKDCTFGNDYTLVTPKT